MVTKTNQKNRKWEELGAQGTNANEAWHRAVRHDLHIFTGVHHYDRVEGMVLKSAVKMNRRIDSKGSLFW